MAFDRALLIALHFHAVEHLACSDIADFKTEQLVYVYEAECVASIHGEWADDIRERTDGGRNLVIAGAGDGQQRRLQAGHVHMRAVERVDGIVRSGLGFDFGDDSAGGCVDNRPERPFELGHVEEFAIGRNRHAIASAFVGLVPKLLAGDGVEGHHLVQTGDVHLAGLRAGSDALHVFRLLAGGHIPGGKALDELVSVIDVENQDTGATVLLVVANAGAGRV